MKDTHGSVKPDRQPCEKTSLSISKRILRKKFLSELREISREEVYSVSKKICSQLDNFPQLYSTSHIAMYASIGNEIDLHELAVKAMKKGMHIYYPRFNQKISEYELVLIHNENEDLITGHMGIPEPKTNDLVVDDYVKHNELLWLVPGVAFDKKGHRLGRGRGYYDRLLRGARGVKIGIAYAWQIIKHVPADSSDATMNYLLSEKCLFNCQN